MWASTACRLRGVPVPVEEVDAASLQTFSLLLVQVARTAASAVAFAQTCFGNDSDSQAVALTMASMDDDKLLRFFDVCPKYAAFKESVEEVLVSFPLIAYMCLSVVCGFSNRTHWSLGLRHACVLCRSS